jgi:hypothetical protein
MSNTTKTLAATSPELLADVLHELERAEQVIRTMLGMMTTRQQMRMAGMLEAARIAGEGATRYHERRAVIERTAAALGRAAGAGAGLSF